MKGKFRRIGGAIMNLLLVAAATPAFPYDPLLQPPAFAPPIALSGTDLTRPSTLFQSGFDPSGWGGELSAWSLDPHTGNPASLRWSAARQLTARDWRERLIVTRRDDGTAVAFRQFEELSPGQQTALGDQATLDYLRGDPALEGTRFRARVSRDGTGQLQRNILGAFVHTRPLDIAGLIYTSANDGMLHAFAADDGHELFAYVPGAVYRHLAALADASNTPHPPWTVDGGLISATISFRDGSNHTLLVGALGAGGQGLYALDLGHGEVVDESAALRLPLWEISDHDDSVLGYTWGTPQIARLNDGRWAVLAGNGYGNETSDGQPGSGTAQLLILDAETGAVIRRLDTWAGDTATPNGLSTPRAIDTDGDGRADHVYAGDLLGNLWRFDLTGADSGAWHVGCNGAPLYHARDPAGGAQAITTAPAIVAHPQQGVRALFGTGRILSAADLDSSGTDAVYGVRDRLAATCAEPVTLLQQTLTEALYADGRRIRTVSRNALDGDHDVWRLDLPAGERVVTDPQTGNGRLRVTTTAPSGNGAVWLLELDAQSGGAPTEIVFDLNGDGVLDTRDDPDADRIAGRYAGTGTGSTPVAANLSATREVVYVNRNETTAAEPSICNGCGAGTIEENGGGFTSDPGNPEDTDGVIEDPPAQLIDMQSPCGEDGCVPGLRRNRGRVAWKELLAE